MMVQAQQFIGLVIAIPDVCGVLFDGVLKAYERFFVAVKRAKCQAFAVPCPGIVQVNANRPIIGIDSGFRNIQSALNLPQARPGAMMFRGQPDHLFQDR